MKKLILKSKSVESPAADRETWIGPEQIAEIAVTSENPSKPVENILDPGDSIGWQAGESGEQQIRVTFKEPMPVRRIQLEFVEDRAERTQEFVIRWAAAVDGERKELIRQRWNFSPRGSTREVEDYRVNLERVLVLELLINPSVSRSDAIASLAHLRIG